MNKILRLTIITAVLCSLAVVAVPGISPESAHAAQTFTINDGPAAAWGGLCAHYADGNTVSITFNDDSGNQVWAAHINRNNSTVDKISDDPAYPVTPLPHTRTYTIINLGAGVTLGDIGSQVYFRMNVLSVSTFYAIPIIDCGDPDNDGIINHEDACPNTWGDGPDGCPTGDDDAATAEARAKAEEEARIAAWQRDSQALDLTLVGAPAHSTNPGMNLQVGRIHKTDLGSGLMEFGYWSEGIYSPLGWYKTDYTGDHYAVPEVNSILTLDQFLHALALAGWYDGYVPAAAPAPAPAADGAEGAEAAPAAQAAPAAPAANSLDMALRGALVYKTDLGSGLFEIGIWKEGVYSTLGWVQYDDGGNLTQLAVPDVNSLITVEQLQQFLASGPSFQ